MGNATDTTAQVWMRENCKMQAMATELVEILYNMYNNGCHDQLRAGLGSVAFRALENAALEEWLR